jgi:hypothetical protein
MNYPTLGYIDAFWLVISIKYSQYSGLYDLLS